MNKFSWARKDANDYEVSSKGDKRFSALNVVMPDGRTLEMHYQCDLKGHDIGGTNWKAGKGKPPVIEITKEELYQQYKALWQQHFGAFWRDYQDIVESGKTVLTDCFANTEINQARAIAEILNESKNGKPLFYTGVGSRETPPEVLKAMKTTAAMLSKLGYVLRSGGAGGADLAFEAGSTMFDIYIPWKGFNNSTSELWGVCDEALQLASQIHPAWERCSQGAKKLHARNCYQVLGDDLETPSEFLICYTKDGKDVGGTATAIKLARANNIPVFNFGIDIENTLLAIEEFLHGKPSQSTVSS